MTNKTTRRLTRALLLLRKATTELSAAYDSYLGDGSTDVALLSVVQSAEKLQKRGEDLLLTRLEQLLESE